MAVTTAGPVQDTQLVGSWFALELDNGITGFFSDVGGLAVDVEVVEYNDASSDTRSRKRPGSTKYGELSLKRGLSADKKFWEWAKKIRDGGLDFRTNGAVVVYDMTSSTETGRWTFTNAWPSKWSASDLDVGSDDVMTEEITLQIEELARVK
jgi:phage tail-like protein